MSRRIEDDEPLFPPWVMGIALRAGPIVVLALLYYLLNHVFRVPSHIALWSLIIVGFATLIFFGGRFYKPYYVNKEGRCVAGGAKQRLGCRHYFPGARLGGGCGRQREDGRCRRVA
jgi:hypothetical protein